MHPTMTLEEVCDALRLSRDAFYRRRKKLYEGGFPRPLPGHTTRWSRALVIAFINQAEAPAAATIGSYVEESRGYLAARYQRSAA